MAKFAIMGFGTVGRGVADVLSMNKATIADKLGEPLDLKYILVRRDLSDETYSELAVKEFALLENDPELELVVETIGGTAAALEYTRRLLRAGKHVVTANKELVAVHGRELLTLAREKKVNYLFEASVGGGIPILRPLMRCLAGNEVQEIAGVLNGTSNYILTRMVKGNITFDAALKEAQALGYAEADPTADVEGIDTCRKLCILSDLAWGSEVKPEQIFVQGISDLDLKDSIVAGGGGYRIKLLGRAVKLPDGRQAAVVSPHLIPADSPLSQVDDVFNAVMIRSNAAGDVMFYGRGAGAHPTASAIMGDMIDALQHRKGERTPSWDKDTALADAETALSSDWYLRCETANLLQGEVIGSESVIVGPLCRSEAEKLAGQVNAKALLPVLR